MLWCLRLQLYLFFFPFVLFAQIGSQEQYDIHFSIRDDLLSDDIIIEWNGIVRERSNGLMNLESRYCIDNGNWSKWSFSHETKISKFNEGAHNLHVQVRDAISKVSETGKQIAFIVQSPFYKQPKYVFPLFVLATFIGFLLWKSERLKYQHAVDLQHDRLRIASDLHDEVGSNLGSIALISQRLSRNRAIPTSVQEDLNIVASTSLETAGFLRDIVWYVNPENDSIDNLVMRLKEIAHSLLIDKRVEFHDDKWEGENIRLQVRRNIYLIAKESFHNILKHSHAEMVEITLSKSADTYKMIIQDNGVGFDMNNVNGGNGLKNIIRRGSEINGEVKISSIPGKGTTISFCFKNHVNT